MHEAMNFFSQLTPPTPPTFLAWAFWDEEFVPQFGHGRVLLALLVLILSLFFKNTLQAVLSRILLRSVSKKKVAYEEVILKAAKEPFAAFVLLFGLEIATQILLAGVEQFRVINVLAMSGFEIALGVILIWTFYRLVDVAAVFFQNVILANDQSLSPQLTPLFSNTLRAIILIIGLLTMLTSLNVNVVSLLAGLGVGGIAVALALQDPLGNFFGSITLIADRTFRVGDWIQMGASTNRVDGIVERIGFRSTRIRTFARTELTIPNSMLTKDVVENFSKRPYRRVQQKLAVAFQTSPEQIRAFVQAVRDAVKTESSVMQDGAYFYFHDITANGYEIVINYFILSEQPNQYL
jgi:MscS family membrane protein